MDAPNQPMLFQLLSAAMADSQTRFAFADAYRRTRDQKQYPIEDADREQQAYNSLDSLSAFPSNRPNYTQQRQDVIRGLSQNILTDPKVRPLWEQFARQEYDYTPAEVRKLRNPDPSPPNVSQGTAPLFYFPPALPVQAIALMLGPSGGTGAGDVVDVDDGAPFKLEYIHRALFPSLEGVFRQLAKQIQMPDDKYIQNLQLAIEVLADKGGASAERRVAYETLCTALGACLVAVDGDEQLMARVYYVVQELERVRPTLQEAAA
jgi:hypothetical protein